MKRKDEKMSINIIALLSEEEKVRNEKYGKFVKEIIASEAIPDDEICDNLRLFLRRRDLMHILFMNELYEKFLPVKGNIVEFGVRWGGNLSLLANCRGIYEPYNYSRKILGFDTFDGFPSVDLKDGEKVKVGDYSVSEGFEENIEKVMNNHEADAPISHIKKFQLIKGDATKTFKEYLDKHPESIFAFAYFDFDIYQPTRECLELLMKHVTKGTVIGFDELNHELFPGETLALKEVLGLDKYKIHNSIYDPQASYIIIE